MQNDQSDDPTPRLEHVTPLVASVPPLPDHAQVVVVGGGIMGASIAYHLAEAGVRDVLVIERDTLGSGSSAKPLGGVRATFSDANNVLLGQRSLAAFETFEARFGTASVCGKWATCSCAAPRPSWPRSRRVSGCRTRSAATAG